MNEKLKWIHAIAGKNDISSETWHEYMLNKHGKTSSRDLTEQELDDVLKYVCDSRLFYNEKQIYLTMKLAEEIGMSKDTLDRMSARFSAHNMEELDDAGIRGMISIVTSMVEKKRKDASTVKSGTSITIRTTDRIIYSDVHPVDMRVYTPRDGYIAIYDASHYMCDVDKMADEKVEKKLRLKEPAVLMIEEPPWSFMVKTSIKCTQYMYRGKMIAMIIATR